MMPHTPLPVQLSSAEACLPSISAAPSRSPLSTSSTHRRPDLHHSSSSIADVVHYASGPTLLPSRIAEAVSDVAVAARASLRAASFLVDVSLESVRFTTSFALDLTRKVLVGAATVTRTTRSSGSGLTSSSEEEEETDATFIQSKAMVEGYSARGVAIIHQNVAFVEFLVQASINLMQSSFRVSASIADESIKVFDELFGDNETSRALAAFIATVQHEFSKTKCAATGGGLTTFATFARAMTTFAFVQTATYKRTARDFNTKTLFDGTVLGAEETARWKALLLGPSKFQSMPSINSAVLASRSDESEASTSKKPLSGVSRAAVLPLMLMTPFQEQEVRVFDGLRPIASDTTECQAGQFSASPIAQPFTAQDGSNTSVSTAEPSSDTVKHKPGTASSRPPLSHPPEIVRSPITGLLPPSGDVNSPARKHSVRRVASAIVSVRCKVTETVEVTQVVEKGLRPPTPCIAGGPTASFGSTDACSTPPVHRTEVGLLELGSQSSIKVRRDWKKDTTTVFTTPDTRPMGIASSEGPRKVSRPTPLRAAIPFPEGRLRSSFRASSPALREQVKDDASLSSAAPKVGATTLPTTPKRSRAARDSKYATTASGSRVSPEIQTPLTLPVASELVPPTQPHPTHLDGIDALMPFPFRPLADNLQHFVRYASASYGSNFLNFLGLGESFLFENNEQAHANEWAFANHANISVEDVLLSSYTDDVGVSLRCSKMAPIVNFVAVDRERQAVVLACRGTLGMSDLLVDLTADYQDVKLGCGEGFVHRGMYAAAHRLSAATGTVASVLRQALEAHPTYGLVVVGHSLGGGIAILVGALWSCRSSNLSQGSGDAQALTTCTISGTAFVTSHSSGLPPGRPIHVFAYGPPPTADPILAKSMVGLVTTVIHHFDCIPMLSMGAVLDLRDISELLAACKGSSTEILCKTVGLYKERFERGHTASEREKEADTTAVRERFPRADPTEMSLKQDESAQGSSAGEAQSRPIAKAEESYGPSEDWLWSLIKTLRAHAQNEKLYPPGTVYLVESFEVYVKAKDNASAQAPGDPQGEETGKTMSARRVVLRACEDVVGRFSEPIFCRSMFRDHLPTNYEFCLDLLKQAQQQQQQQAASGTKST